MFGCGFIGLAQFLPQSPLNTECYICGKDVGDGDPLVIMGHEIPGSFIVRKLICAHCFSKIYNEYTNIRDKKQMLPTLSSYFFSSSVGGLPVTTFTVKRYWFEIAPEKLFLGVE